MFQAAFSRMPLFFFLSPAPDQPAPPARHASNRARLTPATLARPTYTSARLTPVTHASCA